MARSRRRSRTSRAASPWSAKTSAKSLRTGGLPIVLCRAHERLGVELAYPLAGSLLTLFVRVGEDVELAWDRNEFTQLLPAHAGPADSDSTLADCREGQSVHDALGEERAGAHRRGDKER